MKTNGITYLLFLLTFLNACSSGKEKDNPGESLKDTTQTALVWALPSVPGYWFDHDIPVPQARLDHQTSSDASKPGMTIVRDTINGISVRMPEKITLPAEEIIISAADPGPQAYYDISYVSTNSYFEINFDNDIFGNTDYYYTNGIKFELVTPAFAASPFAWPMLPYNKSSMNYHGMKVVQNMYTPTNPDTIHVTGGDRPFAAYLCLGHTKNTLSRDKRYRQYSEIALGLIGPGSLGGYVQGQIHSIDPLGWQNQIQNDLVLNYTAIIEKGIYNPGYFDLNIYASGQAGTLYDNLGAGVRIRAGRLNPYFGMPKLALSATSEGKDALNLQYGITAASQLRLIAYDATLQGGVFNPNNNYTISAADVERLVLQASAGIFFAYKQIGFTYEHFYTSPEFRDAKHHQWGHINISYCF